MPLLYDCSFFTNEIQFDISFARTTTTCIIWLIHLVICILFALADLLLSNESHIYSALLQVIKVNINIHQLLKYCFKHIIKFDGSIINGSKFCVCIKHYSNCIHYILQFSLIFFNIDLIFMLMHSWTLTPRATVYKL